MAARAANADPKRADRTAPGPEPADFVADEPRQLESVVYIVAMLRPLVEMAKISDLPMLAYLLEMAMIEASDVEFRLKSTQRAQARPTAPGAAG